MGATTMGCEVPAKTGEEAIAEFHHIKEENEYECGHGGYTGTFAEKTHCLILTPPHGDEYWSILELKELVDNSKEYGKWGPAVAGRISETEYYLYGWCSC